MIPCDNWHAGCENELGPGEGVEWNFFIFCSEKCRDDYRAKLLNEKEGEHNG